MRQKPREYGRLEMEVLIGVTIYLPKLSQHLWRSVEQTELMQRPYLHFKHSKQTNLMKSE